MCKLTFSKIDQQKWDDALQEISVRSVQSFTQGKAAEHLGVSRKKFIDFEKGRIIDYALLCNWAALVGFQPNINLNNITL